MCYKEYSEKLSTIIFLVDRCAIGGPVELARKLQVFERTARRMIDPIFWIEVIKLNIVKPLNKKGGMCKCKKSDFKSDCSHSILINELLKFI